MIKTTEKFVWTFNFLSISIPGLGYWHNQNIFILNHCTMYIRVCKIGYFLEKGIKYVMKHFSRYKIEQSLFLGAYYVFLCGFWIRWIFFSVRKRIQILLSPSTPLCIAPFDSFSYQVILSKFCQKKGHLRTWSLFEFSCTKSVYFQLHL